MKKKNWYDLSRTGSQSVLMLRINIWCVWSLRIVFLGLIFYAMLYLTFHQALAETHSGIGDARKVVRYFDGYSSDVPDHIELLKQYFHEKHFIPHPLWHSLVKLASVVFNTSIETAAAAVSALFILMWAVLVYVVVLLMTGTAQWHLPVLLRETATLFITFIIIVIGPLILPFYSKIVYLGQGSPNIWHNPTLWAVKPFALLAMLYAVWGLQEQKKAYLMFALLFAIISIFAKPSFILVFLPSLAILIVYKKLFGKEIFYFMLMLLLLSVIVLSYQFLNTFDVGTGITIDILGVWSSQSKNVVISIFLALAFPLVFMRMYPDSMKNNFIVLAWLQVFFGIALYALFAEKGSHFAHGNFSWSYMIAMSLLYLFSIVEFVNRFREIGVMKNSFLGFLLLTQTTIGMYYLMQILQGKNPIYFGVFL